MQALDIVACDERIARGFICLYGETRNKKGREIIPAPPIVYRLMSCKGFRAFEVSRQKQ